MTGNSFHSAEGNGGLQKVTVTHGSGASFEVYLKGASVVSWKDAKGVECLYLSPKSFFDMEQPIRGGIPLAFPQFGLGDLPRHGFARLAPWRIQCQETLKDGSAALTLRLRDSDWTRGMWNHEFALEYTIILRAASLVTQCTVKNTGSSPFDFAFLFHTYLGVSDSSRAKIFGFEGLKAKDTMSGDEFIAGGEPLALRAENKETTVLLSETRCGTVLKDAGARRACLISRSSNLTETVIWNPGEETCAKNADLADDSYKYFVCIEPGAIHQKTVLTPGERAVFSQTITETVA